MDYKFLKAAFTSIQCLNDITDIENMDTETMKTGLEIGDILNSIDESNKKIVPRETSMHYDFHDNGVLTRTYYDGTRKFFECSTPCCHWYEPFEGVCLSECTWCDNPYHCKIKNVPRETYCNIDDLRNIIYDNTPIRQIHTEQLNAIIIAADYIIRGDY